MRLPFQLVYHPRYDLNLGEHVFPARKYRLIRDRLLAEGFAQPVDFVEPQPVSDDDVRRVHDPGWVQRLTTGSLTQAEIVRLEIPYSREMVEGFWLATGGTVRGLSQCTAARSPDWMSILAEDFIVLFVRTVARFAPSTISPSPSVALQDEQVIRKALIVDCDVHHGNGTAAIFVWGPWHAHPFPFIKSDNYPSEKTCVPSPD